MIKIVTDSSALISKSDAEQLPITVVPLNIAIGDKTYTDTVDMNGEKLIKTMDETNKKPFPKTSQPPVGQFVKTYNELTKDGSSVIAIMMTDLLSGTIHSAEQAAQLSDGDIHVVNSKFIDQSLRNLVIEAAKMAKEGNYSVKDIIDHVNELINKSFLYIGASTLDNLEKGGRINKATGLLSRLINLHVVFQLQKDDLKLTMKGRGKKTFDRWFKKLIKKIQDDQLSYLGISYTGNIDLSKQFKKQLQQIFPDLPIKILYTSATVANHTGKGAFAIMGCKK